MRRLRGVLAALLFGLAFGFLAAQLDFLLRRGAGLAMNPSALLGASALYSVPFALFAALWAAFAGSARRLPAILAPLLLLILLGGLANILWLPGQSSLRSVAFDLLFVGIALALMFAAYRLPNAARKARWLAAIWLFASITLAQAATRERSESPAAALAPADAAPDLIVVLFDALRADHTSVYGYARETTPHLSAFAGESIVFERAYAPSSWTKPSVATLFTGVLPESHGNHRISSRLPTELRTLPEMLAERGYHSGIFAENSFVSELFGYGRGVDRIVANEADVAAQTTLGHVLQQLATRSAVAAKFYALALHCNRLDPRQRFKSQGGLDVVAASLQWVDEQPAERPIFLYVHLMKPHAPYTCPAPFDGSFGAPDLAADDAALRPPKVQGLGAFAQSQALSPQATEQLIANYDERILYGDALFGQLLAALRSRGRVEDAVVIALADHGEEFGEHGLFDHGHSLQEGVLRIPLLMRLPRAARAGTRVPQVVRLLDVPATLAAAAALSAPAQLVGQDLWAMVEATAPVADRSVLAQLRHGPGYQMQAWLRGQDKLVQTQDKGRELWQLFQLNSDPREALDRFALLPALGDSLRLELELALAEAALHRHAEADVELDPHTLERLRALGYVE